MLGFYGGGGGGGESGGVLIGESILGWRCRFSFDI